jgi:hypothetical protein
LSAAQALDPPFSPCPNLFVLGAMKAGSTALQAFLALHPDIHMSAIKEPNFFCDDLWEDMAHVAAITDNDDPLLIRARAEGLHTARVTDAGAYQSLFPSESAGARWRGEASPSYLRSARAPAAIAAANPAARVIVTLREPVSRAISHHRMEANEARMPADFADALAVPGDRHGLFASGLYGAAMARVFAAFPREQVLVLETGALADRATLARMIGEFLDLDPAGFLREEGTATNPAAQSRFPALNRALAASGAKELIRRTLPRGLIERGKRVYYGGKDPEIPENIRAALAARYAPDLAQLNALLGDDAPSWARA